MTNLCDVCGKPATQSMLRDPFGKSDEMRFVCSDHGFRIRDPADVAAIEQLHAAVKTAQELAARRLMEIERLQKDLRRANSALVRHGVQTDPTMNTHPSDEPLPVASRDAEHCDYPDCEQHWELVVDWALAAMKKLHESAEPDTDHPEIPAIIPAAAFRAFVDEHARLMRIRASAPQGASRDASSGKPGEKQ